MREFYLNVVNEKLYRSDAILDVDHNLMQHRYDEKFVSSKSSSEEFFRVNCVFCRCVFL